MFFMVITGTANGNNITVLTIEFVLEIGKRVIMPTFNFQTLNIFFFKINYPVPDVTS